MKNIYDFLAKFKTYLNQKFKNDFWIDPKYTPYGNLLVKTLPGDKKIIFKPIDSTLSIGSKRIQDFIINTPIFKKNSIDHYIFIARSFKENAIKLSKSNKQLTLITYDFGTNTIMLIGTDNIDKNILKAINKFSKYIVSKTNKIDKNHIDTKTQPENNLKSLINTERTHRENECQLYFLCPGCGVNLSIPKKYREHDELKCYYCHVTFKNPIFYPNDKTDYKKINSFQNKSLKNDRSIDDVQLNLTKHQKNWLAGIIIFVIILIIGHVTDNSSSSSSNSLYTVNTTTYVATSKSSFDEMFRYINDGDNQALLTLMSYGEVQTLSAGTKVNLISSHFSYCVVRLKGSTRKIWIVTEHITKD